MSQSQSWYFPSLATLIIAVGSASVQGDYFSQLFKSLIIGKIFAGVASIKIDLFTFIFGISVGFCIKNKCSKLIVFHFSKNA